MATSVPETTGTEIDSDTDLDQSDSDYDATAPLDDEDYEKESEEEEASEIEFEAHRQTLLTWKMANTDPEFTNVLLEKYKNDDKALNEAEKWLKRILSRANEEKMDIVTLFVDGSVFAIDGESLIHEILVDPTFKSGQILHFFFLLEAFLKHLQSKGGNFEIWFFKDWKRRLDKCKDPFRKLVQELAIQHIQTVLKIRTVFFENCWSMDFRDYISIHPFSFVMLSLEKYGPETFPFRHLLVCTLAHGVDCAMISPLEPTMSRINTYIIHAQPFIFLRKLVPEFENVWKSVVPEAGNCREVNGIESKETAVSDELCDSPLAFWTRVFMLNQEQCSKLADWERSCLEVILLHAHLLSILPLRSRPLKLSKFEMPEELQDKEMGKMLLLSFLGWAYRAVSCGKVTLSPETRVDLLDRRLVMKLTWLGPTLDLNGMPDLEIFREAYRTLFGCDLTENNTLDLCPDFISRRGEIPVEESRVEETCAELPWSVLRIPKEIGGIVGDMKLHGSYTDQMNSNGDSPFGSDREFFELYHWYCHRQLADEYDKIKESFTNIPPKDKREKRFWEKDRMKYSHYLMLYGESLEGRNVQPQPFSVDERQVKQIASATKGKDTKKKEVVKKKGGGDSKGKPSKKESIIAANQKRLTEERDVPADKAAWDVCLKELKGITADSDVLVTRLGEFIKIARTPQYIVKAYLKIVDICFANWTATDPEERLQKGSYLAAEIVNTARMLQTKAHLFPALTEDERSKFAKLLSKLGFPRVARQFAVVNEAVDTKISTGISESRFQLLYMGPQLDRQDRTDPDKRVTHFIPDTWQRTMLDAIDKNESVIVVAPTSSGKTYSCYYCMERVLKESNDGVVVYVSPTKALVNQVAATIYARFRHKNMPAGRAVMGTFTRDYRQDALTCQVLVTVPECLSILMLSPSRQDWVKKIRYIIFDEVHTLGEEIAGIVWEQLLTIASCPILALSATIANPENLKRWLECVQPKRPVRIIVHSTRYCDLKNSAVLFKFAKESCRPTLNLKSVHPLKALANPLVSGVGAVKQLPSTIDMTPSEVVELYDALKLCEGNSSLDTPHLEEYFAKDVYITRARVIDFLNVMLDFIRTHQLFSSVVDLLPDGALSPNEISLLNPRWRQSDLNKQKATRLKYFVVVELVNLLRQKKMLPAILFLDDRQGVEEVANMLRANFECKETRLFGDDDSRKRLMVLKEKALADSKKSRDAKLTRQQVEDQARDGEDETSQFSTLDMHHPECTLSGRLAGKDKDWIFNNRLRHVHDEKFKSGLLRGLGYHHAGLDVKRRTSVEVLFRRRYVQFVSATGTLAVGIHMPCKTAVFFQDTPWLTPLQFRQRSGRAGRRGFDLVGNVVFCGVDQVKIRHLLTAGIPNLRGQFPLTISFVLRLLILLHEAELDKGAVVTLIRSVLEVPLFVITDPQLLPQLKSFFLYALQVLYFAGLIDVDLTPVCLTSFISHLYYHDPLNIVFAHILRKGLLHDLCKKKSGRQLKTDMIVILSHLYARKPLTPSQIEKLDQNVYGPEKSMVKLPDLPLEFQEFVDELSKSHKYLVTQYLTGVAKSAGATESLPISQLTPTKHLNSNVVEDLGWTLGSALSANAVQNAELIPMASLSGCNDEEIVEKSLSGDATVFFASGLVFEPRLLPILNHCPLNAYALDFYRHESLEFLYNYNEIKRGEVFDLLKDFVLVCLALSESISVMTEDHPSDPVRITICQLTDDFRRIFSKHFERVKF